MRARGRRHHHSHGRLLPAAFLATVLYRHDGAVRSVRRNRDYLQYVLPYSSVSRLEMNRNHRSLRIRCPLIWYQCTFIEVKQITDPGLLQVHRRQHLGDAVQVLRHRLEGLSQELGEALFETLGVLAGDSVPAAGEEGGGGGPGGDRSKRQQLNSCTQLFRIFEDSNDFHQTILASLPKHRVTKLAIASGPRSGGS